MKARHGRSFQSAREVFRAYIPGYESAEENREIGVTARSELSARRLAEGAVAALRQTLQKTLRPAKRQASHPRD